MDFSQDLIFQVRGGHQGVQLYLKTQASHLFSFGNLKEALQALCMKGVHGHELYYFGESAQKNVIGLEFDENQVYVGNI